MPRRCSTIVAAAALLSSSALAGDPASMVALARAQVERGDYAGAGKTLAGLLEAEMPKALVVEAALLEATAALVTKGHDDAEAACSKAIVASGYDPEVARDQSPKLRQVCRSAAEKARATRLSHEGVELKGLRVDSPSIAWQPVRIAAKATGSPDWLRVVARVSSSALDGPFDVALAPSLEGPLRGTLDPSWIRPRSIILIELVAQDRFGDLGHTGQTAVVHVPQAEAMVVLGKVPETAWVTVDGVIVRVGPGGRVPVVPGKHHIAMELADSAAASTTVDLAPGSETTVALSPQKPGGRRLAWVATGVGLALGAASGVLLLSADSRAREIEELAARREDETDLPAVDYSEIRSKDDDRQVFSTLGMSLLVLGAAASVAAVTLWVWPEPRRSSATTVLRAQAGPSGVSFAGTF